MSVRNCQVNATTCSNSEKCEDFICAKATDRNFRAKISSWSREPENADSHGDATYDGELSTACIFYDDGISTVEHAKMSMLFIRG